MGHLFEMLLSVVIGFGVLLVLIRIIGNKQLGQLNVFTYISGIVIGSIIADTILHQNIEIWKSVIALIVWVGLLFVVEYISLKSVKARELLDGQPIILIKKGLILREALKKERLTLDDLTMLLRTNMVFSVSEVDYAILEPNGDLSVLKKQGNDNNSHIPATIIMDGRVIVKNLLELGVSRDVILENIRKDGHKIEDIFYAEILADGRVYLQTRDGDVETMW